MSLQGFSLTTCLRSLSLQLTYCVNLKYLEKPLPSIQVFWQDGAACGVDLARHGKRGCYAFLNSLFLALLTSWSPCPGVNRKLLVVRKVV